MERGSYGLPRTCADLADAPPLTPDPVPLTPDPWPLTTLPGPPFLDPRLDTRGTALLEFPFNKKERTFANTR